MMIPLNGDCFTEKLTELLPSALMVTSAVRSVSPVYENTLNRTEEPATLTRSHSGAEDSAFSSRPPASTTAVPNPPAASNDVAETLFNSISGTELSLLHDRPQKSAAARAMTDINFLIILNNYFTYSIATCESLFSLVPANSIWT